MENFPYCETKQEKKAIQNLGDSVDNNGNPPDPEKPRENWT